MKKATKRGYMITPRQYEHMQELQIELTKLRCWISGYNAGVHNAPMGTIIYGVPSSEVLSNINALFNDITRDKRR